MAVSNLWAVFCICGLHCEGGSAEFDGFSPKVCAWCQLGLRVRRGHKLCHKWSCVVEYICALCVCRVVYTFYYMEAEVQSLLGSVQIKCAPSAGAKFVQ